MASTSRSQGRAGHRPAGGRLGKSRERMNKNPIEGRPGEASWHHTAKPFDAVREVNGAVVRRRAAFLPGETPRGRSGGESTPPRTGTPSRRTRWRRDRRPVSRARRPCRFPFDPDTLYRPRFQSADDPSGLNEMVRQSLFIQTQRDLQRFVQEAQFVRGKHPNVIGQSRLVKAHELVAMDAACMLQSFVNPHRNLCRQSIVHTVDRSADRR